MKKKNTYPRATRALFTLFGPACMRKHEFYDIFHRKANNVKHSGPLRISQDKKFPLARVKRSTHAQLPSNGSAIQEVEFTQVLELTAGVYIYTYIWMVGWAPANDYHNIGSLSWQRAVEARYMHNSVGSAFHQEKFRDSFGAIKQVINETVKSRQE